LFYDIGEEVKAVVVDVSFKKYNDIAKTISDNAEKLNKKTDIDIDDLMEVICSFNKEGLGPMKWWTKK